MTDQLVESIQAGIIMDKSSDDKWDWLYLMSRLSLDQAKPLLSYMDLRIPNDAEFIQTAREWVYSHLLRPYGQGPNVNVLIEKIAQKTTPAFADYFYKWVIYCYLAPEAKIFTSWFLRFAGWAQVPQEWSMLALPPSVSAAARNAFLKISDGFESVGDMAHTQHQYPLSDWDLGIYTALSFDDDENDPLLNLTWACVQRQFYCFWLRLDRTLSPDQMLGFLNSANNLESRRGTGFKFEVMATHGWPSC